MAVMNPSEAMVDAEGVRGMRAAVALAGIGLSKTCGENAGKRLGSPVEMSYDFCRGDSAPEA